MAQRQKPALSHVDAEGRVHGAINAMVDITERKSAEHALAAAKDDLARQGGGFHRRHDLPHHHRPDG